MYSAVELSNYIVSKCIQDNFPISNLQLQKILYYIQKDFVMNDNLAFPDDIEAWQFGPVVPNVYYYFCSFGAMPICIKNNVMCSIDEADKKKIDEIVEAKRVLNPWDLVEETHKPNGAWARTYRDGTDKHCVIPVSLIKEAG